MAPHGRRQALRNVYQPLCCAALRTPYSFIHLTGNATSQYPCGLQPWPQANSRAVCRRMAGRTMDNRSELQCIASACLATRFDIPRDALHFNHLGYLSTPIGIATSQYPRPLQPWLQTNTRAACRHPRRAWPRSFGLFGKGVRS